MGKIKKYKNVIERFLSGETGQRFFNFAYSIGAAVVILGALFKILHLEGGNEMLTIGMGTEVLMFILTAFDRPEHDYKWEQVFPVLASGDPDDRPDFAGGGNIVIGGGAAAQVPAQQGVTEAEAKAAVGLPQGIDLTEEDSRSLSESIAKMAAASDQLSRMAELTDATQQYLSQMAGISEQMQRLNETIYQRKTQVRQKLSLAEAEDIIDFSILHGSALSDIGIKLHDSLVQYIMGSEYYFLALLQQGQTELGGYIFIIMEGTCLLHDGTFDSRKSP